MNKLAIISAGILLSLMPWTTVSGQECRKAPDAECVPEPRWAIDAYGRIAWDITEGRIPHHDHIEMSGEQIACVLRWEVDGNARLTTERSLVFPMLRTLPNNTHASLMMRIATDIPSLLMVDGMAMQHGRTERITIDGMFCSEETWCTGRQNIGTGSGTAPVPSVRISRKLFPSVDKPLVCERYTVCSIRKRPMTVYIPEYSQVFRTVKEKGKDGVYIVEASIGGAGTFVLNEGESVSFDVIFSGRKADEPPFSVDAEKELTARMDFITNDIDSSLVLETPDSVVNTMFRYAKIRTSESICKTAGGYMHAPGGESYYAAIWANDQAEYVNPFFPFLGYNTGNLSAINSFRHFARFMNDGYMPLPSSIIAEGTDIWNGAGDRGDAAMIAYGAGRFALAYADRTTAEELWPLIEWCLEYCRRNLNGRGVVASDTDELEGRFEAGSANLCTSSLYYDALLSAAWLCEELGKQASAAKSYRKQATRLRQDMESYFGASVSGYQTYRYYDGNELLRSWICIPLTVGIHDRAQATADALCSPLLWKEDGLLTEQGSSTYWDRSTLYALRGLYSAGLPETATQKLHSYSSRRLLGDHVPYAIEAWPEGSQRHLAAESGLYCRIVTEGLFGIRPTGFRSLELSPSMPAAWDRMALKSIKAFGQDMDLTIRRTGKDSLEVTVSNGTSTKVYRGRNNAKISIRL
ncbi:MAG: hypothetical protein NC308_02525 [Clostridium sp.]|nr:hypothetical protein [Bacteroides sp.]MCM1197739.1 hypothetical protein [Clostridium sp.]